MPGMRNTLRVRASTVPARAAGAAATAASTPAFAAAPARAPPAPCATPSPATRGCNRGFGAAPPHWPQHAPAP